MSDLSNLWGETKVNAMPKKEYEEIPAGVYTAMIEDVTVDQTKEVAKVSLKYKITNGDFQNRTIFVNQMLNKVGISILKETLAKFGYTATPASVDDLVAVLKSYSFKDVEAYISNRKSDYNGKSYTHYSARINKVLTDDEIGFSAI